jgi:hypothetical protein
MSKAKRPAKVSRVLKTLKEKFDRRKQSDPVKRDRLGVPYGISPRRSSQS